MITSTIRQLQKPRNVHVVLNSPGGPYLYAGFPDEDVLLKISKKVAETLIAKGMDYGG